MADRINTHWDHLSYTQKTKNRLHMRSTDTKAMTYNDIILHTLHSSPTKTQVNSDKYTQHITHNNIIKK